MTRSHRMLCTTAGSIALFGVASCKGAEGRPAAASRDTTAVAPAAANTSSDAGAAAVRSQWKAMGRYITDAAAEMSETEYAFRPVAGVGTFGALIGHIAGTQDLICSAVLGQPQPAEDAVEKSAKTKAALVAALAASNTRCETAYAINGTAAAAQIDLFGGQDTKAGALALNAVHNAEHYGNIVTYMRMQGKVPPSSKQ